MALSAGRRTEVLAALLLRWLMATQGAQPVPLVELTRWRGDGVVKNLPIPIRRFVKTHRPHLGPLEQLAVTCGMPAVYWTEG